MKLSDTDFPREVRERMEQVLLPGDEILWAGTAMPGMKRNLLVTDGVSGGVFFLLFSAAWCPTTLFYVITALSSDDTPAEKMAALEFMLPFILVSCWFIRIWWKLLFGDKSRYYAVSSRFLLRHENNTLKAAPLHDDIIQNLNIRKDGSGDIIIREAAEKEGLFCLAEADRVAGILQRAAENIPPVPMPPAHRDLTHADEQLPVSVRMRLRETMVPGDRLLWADRPLAWLPGWLRCLLSVFMAVFSLSVCYTLMQGTMPRTSTFILFSTGWGILMFLFYIRHLENHRFYFLTEQAMGEVYAAHPAELYPLSELFLREITITVSGTIRLKTNRMTWERLNRIDTLLPLLLRGWEKKHSAKPTATA